MRILFLLFYILISASLTAQEKRFTPADLKEYFADLSINKPLPVGYKLPFSSIKVIDSRPDTTKIGFIRVNPNKSGQNSYKKILIDKGLRQSLESIINEHYHSCFSNDSLQLLIVIKRFWADPFPDRQIQEQGDIARSSVFDMYIRFELFFLKSDLYYPVKRIDTLFQAGEDEPIPGCDDRKMRDCEMYGYSVSKVIEGIDFEYEKEFE